MGAEGGSGCWFALLAGDHTGTSLTSGLTMPTTLNAPELTLQGCARAQHPESWLRWLLITVPGRAVGTYSVVPPQGTLCGSICKASQSPRTGRVRTPISSQNDLPVLRTRCTFISFRSGDSPGDGESYKISLTELELETQMLLKLTQVTLPAGKGHRSDPSPAQSMRGLLAQPLSLVPEPSTFPSILSW